MESGGVSVSALKERTRRRFISIQKKKHRRIVFLFFQDKKNRETALMDTLKYEWEKKKHPEDSLGTSIKG